MEAMGGDWANLPGDLLIDIAKRFRCLEDLIAFSFVCSSWNVVFGFVKPNWAPAMPWLIMPENRMSFPSCNWTVLNPSTNKHCKAKLPKLFGLDCICCGDGWIFAHGPENKTYLFNPLTRVRLSLPSALTLPAMADSSEEYYERNDKEWSRRTWIRTVTVVKIPPNNGILVLLVSDLYRLAFAKPGDSAWTALQCTNDYFGVRIFVEDVLSFNDQIMIIYGDGRLMGLGVDQLLCKENEIVPLETYVPGSIEGLVSIYREGPLENFYLVEYSGHLLVVLRYTKNYRNFEDLWEEEDCLVIDFATMWFEVYRFDSGAKDWVRVYYIGDVSLFVGNHSAVAVCSSNANCRPNCVYFTDDKPEPTKIKGVGIEFVGCEIGIYGLLTGKMEELDSGSCIVPKFCSPFWYMPKLV